MSLFEQDSRNALQAKEYAQWIAFAPFVFQAARVLRNSGILAGIESAGAAGLTLEEVAQHARLPLYGVRVLLEAGLGIGLVLLKEEHYTLTRTARFLLHDRLTRANMDFTQDVNYLGLFHLEDAIRSGEPSGLQVFGNWKTVYEALAHLPEGVRRSWFAFDHYYSDIAFPAALPLVFERKPRRLLDIGGNTGRWAIQCAQYDAEVQITVLDLPGQLRDAKAQIKERGLSGRISLHETNLLDEEADIPQGFDAIWLSQFLDCFSEAQIVSILRRCVQALGSEGSARIYILEPFWDRQRYAAAAFCLQMASLYFATMANGNSQMYRFSTFLDCVADAGLEVEAQHDGLGVSHTLLVCRNRA